MPNCSRCRLSRAITISNMVVNLCGMGMIIYSLWLLKIWKVGMAEVGSSSSYPRPWFIYTVLGVGVVVCLSPLLGHVVSNYIDAAALSIYILVIGSILFCEIVVIVAILFKIDWQKKIANYLDGKHPNFENTLMFHLRVCRLIGFAILLAQVNVLVLAIVLWAIGPEARDHCSNPTTPEITCSFLVPESESPPLARHS